MENILNKVSVALGLGCSGQTLEEQREHKILQCRIDDLMEDDAMQNGRILSQLLLKEAAKVDRATGSRKLIEQAQHLQELSGSHPDSFPMLLSAISGYVRPIPNKNLLLMVSKCLNKDTFKNYKDILKLLLRIIVLSDKQEVTLKYLEEKREKYRAASGKFNKANAFNE